MWKRLLLEKKIYRSVAELQADLDKWMHKYNNERRTGGSTVLAKRDANFYQ